MSATGATGALRTSGLALSAVQGLGLEIPVPASHGIRLGFRVCNIHYVFKYSYNKEPAKTSIRIYLGLVFLYRAPLTCSVHLYPQNSEPSDNQEFGIPCPAKDPHDRTTNTVYYCCMGCTGTNFRSFVFCLL